MKIPVILLGVAAAATLVLKAADQEADPAAPTQPEQPAQPAGPRFIVIEAKAPRAELEKTLNERAAQGYTVSGMNNDYIVMEKRPPVAAPSAVRKRVVLPTN